MQLGRYAKMPTHLRWELYPLAGERNRPWGGSYLEESDWWTKPPEEKNLLGEAKFIGEEVLFFKEYYHLNRKFWYFVYPFHIGIFLFAGFVVLLLVGALTMVGDMAVSAGSTSAWGSLVYYLTIIAGSAGLILGSLGCVGLLIRRITDNNLAPYTKRIDYINLIFVMAVFLTGLSSWAFADSTFATAREYMKGLITFNSVGGIETIIATHIVLLLLILLYMPFTNMMHFFAKSFAYHSVRWDDGPNLRGSKLEKRLGPLLNQPVSWSAPHIEAITRWSDAVPGTVEEHVPRFQEKEE
jgi:nitrate reductase gamma subunit